MGFLSLMVSHSLVGAITKTYATCGNTIQKSFNARKQGKISLYMEMYIKSSTRN